MSERHIRRLSKVREEKEAAEEAVGYCLSNYGELRGFLSSDPLFFDLAARNLEKTYFIRLCADAEAMLYRHLVDHWPSIGTTVDEPGAQLINRTRRHLNPAQNNTLDGDLADRALAVIGYRNYLSHGEKSNQPEVRFGEALEVFGELLLKLPEMKH